MILFLLAAVLCAAGVALKLWQKHRQTEASHALKFSVGQSATKFMPWLLICISLITLCFSIFSFSNKVNAADSQVSADNIKLEYNIDTKQLSCNSVSLINNTGSDLILSDVNTNLLNENATNLAATLKLGDTVIYDKAIPGQLVQSVDISQNNKIDAKFSLNPDIASKLDDGQIASITYSMKIKPLSLYPQPNNIKYNGEKFNLSSSINAVCDNSIDQYTKNYAKEIFENKGISLVFVPEIPDQGNFIALNTSSDTSKNSALANIDGHEIDINCHGINITGQDTDAVYLGLTTLKQILVQSTNVVQGLHISDYAQAEWRGFIEGYYGIPWSNENRISLMEFGRDFKMNSYIFAPKDDEYHSAKWREQYPADKLNKMKELADAGLKNKVDFTWAIHPFMEGEGIKPFNFNDYNNELNNITAKYEQLYSIGVKHFGLSADDMPQGAATPEQQLKLIRDLDAWCKSKSDVKKLVFVPECYQKGRGGEKHFAEYWNVLKNAPQSVDLMWTGDDVYAPTTQDTFNYFTQVSNHQAYMWWNFPVNDYCKNHLEMGPAEGLVPNVKGFIGLVANPMQQAQASKIALFSVANYLWNTSNFDANTSWKNAFQFVDSGAPESLNLLSSHMCFSKLRWQANFDESVYMQASLKNATTQLDADTPLDDQLSAKLLANYQEIKAAIKDYKNNHNNAGLYEEIQPWLDSFDLQCDASLDALNAIAKVKDGNIAEAKALYEKAKKEFADSKNCPVPVLPDATPVFAEAGSKYLVPFVNTMFSFLEKQTS